MSISENLKRLRIEKKLSQKRLADLSGVSQQLISQIEAGVNRTTKSLPALARALSVEIAEIDPDFASWASQDAEISAEPEAAVSRIIPGEDLVGIADLPVYAAAMGGTGHLVVTFEPIDWVKRPAPLARVKGGYGLLITGESMVPAYWPGDTALVNPHLPPERGTDVILYHTPPSQETEAIVKHLSGFNDREWTLEQYRPAQEFKEFRKEWPICHRVVGKYNRR